MRGSKQDVPVAFQEGPTAIRQIEWGGMNVEIGEIGGTLDVTPLFRGLPDDQCQCPHWGYMIRGTIRVHTSDGYQDFEAGEAYYWAPGHNLEAVTDAEYLEITRSEDYDELMEHCARVLAG